MTNHDDMWNDDDSKIGLALALSFAAFAFALVSIVLGIIAVFK